MSVRHIRRRRHTVIRAKSSAIAITVESEVGGKKGID